MTSEGRCWGCAKLEEERKKKEVKITMLSKLIHTYMYENGKTPDSQTKNTLESFLNWVEKN